MRKKLCLKRYCGNDGSLGTFLACKLIPLDKNPWVRPIGIGEVIRRIPGRAVMTTFKKHSRKCRCEAAVHALSSVFSEDGSNTI